MAGLAIVRCDDVRHPGLSLVHLRVLKAGGALSILGVYSGKLLLPLDAIAAGLRDHKIVTTLCPGGKERMRRLMNADAVRSLRFHEGDQANVPYRTEPANNRLHTDARKSSARR